MGDTAAEMLKDRLNDMERNAYDGIDFRQDVNAAYALADELGNERDQLKADNAKLRDAVMDMYFQIKETCDICDGDFCSNYDEENDCCRFDTIVDELGIEVQE